MKIVRGKYQVEERLTRTWTQSGRDEFAATLRRLADMVEERELVWGETVAITHFTQTVEEVTA